MLNAQISMSFIYASRKCTDKLSEIGSRLYLWNYLQLEQPFQIKSIATFGSEVYLTSSSYNNEGIIVLDSTGTRKATCLQTTHQITCSCSSITISRDSIYISHREGITIYDRNTSQEVCQFAQNLTKISDVCMSEVDGNLYVGMFSRSDKSHGVLVYKSNGTYLHVLTHDVHPSCMSFDCNGLLHVCDGKYHVIKVYDTGGNMMFTYGTGHVTNPSRIVTHPEGYTLVLESVSLAIFLRCEYMYSIDVCDCGISDVCVTCDGVVWISVGKSLLRIPPSLILYRPPPPLSLLCQSIILLHINELPVELLPVRYTRLLQDWMKCIEITISSLESDSKPQTLARKDHQVIMKVREGVSKMAVRLLLEKKLAFSIEDSHLQNSNLKSNSYNILQ